MCFCQLATVPCLLNPGKRKPCWFFYVRVPWVQVCCLVIMVLVFLLGFWCTCLLTHCSSACLLFWWWQEAVGYKKSGTEGHCIPWALTIICSLHSRHLKTFLTGSTHHWKGFYKGTCVLKWEGTDMNPGLSASTSFPEPKGRSWAHRESSSQWCLVCTERGMGLGKGKLPQGTLEKAEMTVFYCWIWCTVLTSLPMPTLDAEFVMGAALELSCLGSQVFSVVFIVLSS